MENGLPTLFPVEPYQNQHSRQYHPERQHLLPFQQPPLSLTDRHQLQPQDAEQQQQQQHHIAPVCQDEQLGGFVHIQAGPRQPLPVGLPQSAPSQPQNKMREKMRPESTPQTRNRPINSCMECRQRKHGCDRIRPVCSRCKQKGLDCIYTTDGTGKTTNRAAVAEHKEKMKSADRRLQKSIREALNPGSRLQTSIADELDGYEEDQDMEPTPMVSLDLTYGNGADTEEMIDLGFQVGRMRITERIGGMARPHLAEEIKSAFLPSDTASTSMSPTYDDMDSILNPGCFRTSLPPGTPIPSCMRPSEAYLPPADGLLLGQAMKSPPLEYFLDGISQSVGDHLLRRYLIAVHPIARCVHWPSFHAQYISFWDNITRNNEPRASTQALVFAAWFTAAVSLDEQQVQMELKVSKTDLVHRLQLGTETALSKANFLKTTKVDIMQAFIMYLIPLCRAEVSRAHSVLVGAAIRMAECMGLHRDGEAYGLGALETHVRRILWHQLCFLDIRTCEAQGPNPSIRREDYDTKFPINCPDEEFSEAAMAPASHEHWTPALLQIIRFELASLMRIIWTERRKIGAQKKKGLKELVDRIQDSLDKISKKYKDFFDDRDPIQRYTRVVMFLLMHRLIVMVLHPYHYNAANPIGPRMRNSLVTSGVGIIENACQLESNPFFQDWAWYRGAYQQFQVALLLATEVHEHPDSKLVEKIWPCLDYVFGLDPNLAREEKLRAIFAEILRKQEIYMDLRKQRAPTDMAHVMSSNAHVPSSPVTSTSQLHSGFYQQQQQQQQPPPRLDHQQMVRCTQPLVLSPPPSCERLGAFTSVPQQPVMRNTVWAGVSNGEVLWSLPQQGSPESSGNSDGGSAMGAHMAVGFMENIDWDQVNIVFPNELSVGGDLAVIGFIDQSLGGGTSWKG